MTYTIQLSNPVKPDTIPSTDDVLQAARSIFSEDVEWKEGKTFVKGTVKTFSANIPDSGTWYMRASEHDGEDGTFDDFWNGLGVNHALNEAKFIPEIEHATLLKKVEPGVSEVWSLHYNLGILLAKRTFTVLLVTHLDDTSSPRQGWVVSVPFDATPDKELSAKESKGVKGSYAAVERITETADGRVEWKMATISSPGGAIPGFLSAPAVPKAIAQDVKHFLHFLQDRRSKDNDSLVEGPTRAPAENLP